MTSPIELLGYLDCSEADITSPVTARIMLPTQASMHQSAEATILLSGDLHTSYTTRTNQPRIFAGIPTPDLPYAA
jgi:hypothetical protein